MSINAPPNPAPAFVPSPHPDLPNIDLVLSTHINTLSHIPRACRDSHSYSLSALYGNIVNDPSVFYWSLLLIFVVHDTDEVLRALIRKHPQGSAPTLPDDPCPTMIPIPSETVRSAVLSFNADTAPCPSGFRANYFKDLFSSPNPNQRQRYFSSLTSLVNSMNQGKIPIQIRPFLFAATLQAAKKKQGGIRPIAIGDVYAHLTSKCLASLLAEEVASVFRSFQLGVKIRGGCESVIHATSATFFSDCHPEKRYILKLDLENAYNNADRLHFIAETRKRFPSLIRRPTFSSAAIILKAPSVRSRAIPSAGFSLALAFSPSSSRSTEKSRILIANQWIMDDCTVIGSLEDIKKVVEIISTVSPSKGFFLNKSKSTIWVGHDF